MCENRILPLRFAHSLSGLWPRVSPSLGKYRPTATIDKDEERSRNYYNVSNVKYTFDVYCFVPNVF